jgi:hypothetical protein
MKIRWRDGKAQIVAYVPERGRCEVVDEGDEIHNLLVKYGLASSEVVDKDEFDLLEETPEQPHN